jgi:hypothetical protein
VAGETGSTKWQLDRGNISGGVHTAVAAVVVSWGSASISSRAMASMVTM